jgi:hypothetical protein
MHEPADSVFDHSWTVFVLTWRGGRGERRAHYFSRLPCVPRPDTWMAQETGLT